MIEKYKELQNYSDIKFLYNNYNHIKDFIDNNNYDIIINNLNTFITIFKEEFKIEKYESNFIISCLFEQNYFQDTLLKKINFNIFKKLIVRKVIETLNDISNENDIIEFKVLLCGFYLNNYNKKINNNYNIIKNLIYNKKIKSNYCYLFDNIKYFNNNKQKKDNYLLFITLIIDDYLSEIIVYEQ